VIVASGAVKHEEFVGEVKKVCTKLSSDPTTAAQLVSKDPAYFTGSEVGRCNLKSMPSIYAFFFL
jgi:processing peptidase subunit beta